MQARTTRWANPLPLRVAAECANGLLDDRVGVDVAG